MLGETRAVHDMRLLIVDDSLTMARYLKTIVEGLGNEVVGHAKNGAEAIRMYGELRPDVVFLDIVMPEMDGLSALRALKAIDEKLQAIIVSSAAGVGSNVEEARKFGATAILSKPFTKEAVAKALEKCQQ